MSSTRHEITEEAKGLLPIGHVDSSRVSSEEETAIGE